MVFISRLNIVERLLNMTVFKKLSEMTFSGVKESGLAAVPLPLTGLTGCAKPLLSAVRLTDGKMTGGKG
jgi:hypothetical protein